LPGLYSDDILGEVARANDIVEVVSGYFPLKRAGKDYRALCPFHAEKSPSFHVSPSKQIFKCFGCGKGGSVFNFVMAKESVTFPEAVRILAERAGIELKNQVGAEKSAGERRQVRDVMEWAAGLFQKALVNPKAGARGREYLESRAITQETIDRFRIGYAPEGWDNLIRAAARDSMPLDVVETAGLIIRRDDGSGFYDRFRGRVMFPILDSLNRVLAFGGRAMGDEQPKYLNSPETPIFHKAETLYGLPQARQAIEADRRAVVVEGYFDVVMPHQVGVPCVVATLGTALTNEHVRALKRFADEVVLLYDSDLAGQRAADRGMELFLAEDVRILIAVVPQGKDPFDFCRAEGGEAFKTLLAGARDAFAFKWDVVNREFNAASSPVAQKRALEAMLAAVVKAPSLAQEDLRLQRDLILGHMSRTLGIAEDTLRAEMARIRRSAGRTGAGTENPAPESAAHGPRWAAERELMTALLCMPSRLDQVLAVLPPDRMEDPQLRGLYEALLANPSRRDADIESIVRQMEDGAMSALAVELFERGDALNACREASDTSAGPLGRMLDDSLAALQSMEADAELQARGRAARENKTGDTQALQAYMEARLQSQGFLPPSARRKGSPGT
jgi:DNA primase